MQGPIRDHIGRWVKGFVRKLNITFSIDAEIWALRDDLALECNINNLCVDTDASGVVELIKSEVLETHPLSTILFYC